MNRVIHLSLCILFATVCLRAQDSSTTGWKYSVLTNLTLTLNTYSDNWQGSEFSAMSWGAQFTGTARKAITSWLTNKNVLKFGFGQTALQQKTQTGDKRWLSPSKSSDLIDFETLLRFTLQSFIDPFIAGRAVSQFVDQRFEGEDVYGNPLTLTESFGGIRDLLKTEHVTWTARLGGAVRQNVDRNYNLPVSVRPKRITNDGGIELVTDFKAASKDNRLSYLTQLKVYEALFSSLEQSEQDETPPHWRYPDISWENTLGVTLTKYVMLNFYAQLLYDRQIHRDVRFRQTVGLALTLAHAN